MKKILLSILLLQIINCYSQDLAIEKQINLKNLEVGKCYFSEIIEKPEISNKEIEKPFILEIIDPIFKEEIKNISNNEFKSKIENEGYYRYQIKESHYKIRIRKSDKYDSIHNQKAFVFCLIEVPGEWATINKKELERDSVEIKEYKRVANSKLIKKYVEHEPKELIGNQLFFKSGNWSEFKEVVSNSCHGPNGNQLVLKIKRKLIKNGYQLIENNILDKDTREALNDFQRKNNLKENQVDLETIRKLGIDY